MLLKILDLWKITLCPLLYYILTDVSKGYIAFETLVTINQSLRRDVPENLDHINFETNCGKYDRNKIVDNGDC
jgi:hypothetical protein